MKQHRLGKWLARALLGVPSWLDCRDSVDGTPAFGTVDPVGTPVPPERRIIRAALHAHTTYSDGRGSVGEVAAAARASGVDLLVLADHDTLQPLADGWEGYSDSLLVLVGAELRTDHGWLLALGLPAGFRTERSAGRLLDRIALAGGIAFAALPDHPSMSWRGFTHPALAGLEVMNLHSLSRQAASLPRLAALLSLWALGRRMAAMALLTPRPRVELDLWDEQLRRGRFVGLASADAHGQVRVGRRSVAFPNYGESFSLIQTHLVCRRGLTSDVEQDRRTVLNALREGQCRLVYPHRGNAEDVRVWHEVEGRCSTEGEVDEWTEDGRIHIRSPYPDTLTRLIRDGQLVGVADGVSATFPTSVPGCYRVELLRVGRRLGALRLAVHPWIYTNPIFLHRTAVPAETPDTAPTASVGAGASPAGHGVYTTL